MQTKLSAIGKFWQFAKSRDLHIEAPIIQHKIKKWNRQAPDPTQATPFSVQELEDFSALPLQTRTAYFGAYAWIAAHGGERGGEMVDLQFEDVIFCPQNQNHESICWDGIFWDGL